MTRIESAVDSTVWRLGVDIGGTTVKLAVVDESGKTCYESSNATRKNRGLTPFLVDIREAIQDAIAGVRRRGIEVSAIGIGVPGHVEGNRIVGGINNIPILKGISLAEELAVELPITVENDAYLMGVAESRFGTAAGSDNAVFLTVGTGIGSALMLNGRFYRGANNRACEIGHMVLSHGGEPCTCGNDGCFEALASTSALLRRYLAKNAADSPLPLSGPELVRRYLEGDKAAMDAFSWHFEYLASGVASLINIFDPQQIVIGGGIAESGGFYLRKLRRRVAERVTEDAMARTSIDLAALGNRAGCIGATCLLSEDSMASAERAGATTVQKS